jgi:hypothetical protein
MSKLYTIDTGDGREIDLEANSPEEATSQAASWVAKNPRKSVADKVGDMALDRAKVFGEGALSAIPGVATARALSSPDSSGVNKAASIAGDIGGAALLATPGGIARKLGAGALISGGLEATGINPAARWLAKKQENMIPNPNYPSKVAGIEGLGTAANFASQVPGNIAASLTELAPSLLAGKAIGGSSPRKTSPYTTMLEDLGGKPLPSAYATSKTGASIGRGIERVARTNPLVEGSVEPMDTANIESVRGYASKNIPGSLESSGSTGGSNIKAIMDKANLQNQENYGKVMDRVKNIKTLPEGIPEPGKVAALKLKGILKTTDFIPDEAVKLINKTADRLEANGNNPSAYDAEIKRFNYENQKLLEGKGPGVADSLDHYFGKANEILKQTHYDTLNKVRKGLGDALKNTNFDYAQTKSGLFGPFAKMAGGRVEDLPGKMLSSGEEFRNTAKTQLGEEGYGELQNEAMAEMFRRSMDAQGNLNAKSLELMYGKRFKGMDWRPEQRAVVDNVLGMMKKAGLGSLNVENPSGTAGTSSRIAHDILSKSIVGIPPLLIESLAQKAYLKSPSITKPFRKPFSQTNRDAALAALAARASNENKNKR